MFNIADSIEREYGKPIRELSTDVPLYWFCAWALRHGDKMEAQRLWECGDIVWC